MTTDLLASPRPTSTRTSRASALAVAAAAPAAAFGALEVLHPQAQPFADTLDLVIEIVFVVAMTAAAAALTALAARGPRTARLAFRTAAAGHAALAVAATATALAGQDVWGPVFLLGLLGSVVGLAAALVLDVRRRVDPRGAGVVLLAALVGSFVVQTTGAGGLVLAVGWLGVARLVRDA